MSYFLFNVSELFSVFAEGFIALFVPINLTCEKPSNRKTHIYILSFCILYTTIMTLIGQFMFSPFITAPFSILLTFAATFAVSTEHAAHKICATSVTWFFMKAFDCITAFVTVILSSGVNDIPNRIALLSQFGEKKAFYLFINKLLQIVIALFLKKAYRYFIFISKKSVCMLSVATLISYTLMLSSKALITASSLQALRLSVIVLIGFIIAAVAITIIVISRDSKVRSTKHKNELSSLTSSFLEKNYNDLNNSQDVILKQIHDFKNHLRTLSGMLDDNSPAKEYISQLLEVSYHKAAHCNSGNKVIDSVINCKMSEAINKGIKFTYKIDLKTKLSIPMIDICAILSNQLDNALEAYEKTDNLFEKCIDVSIYQKGSLVFFKVTNTVPKNPFEASRELKTTKENSNSSHGFGIKIIRDTAKKHNGSLKIDYVNNRFVSVAMISDNETTD